MIRGVASPVRRSDPWAVTDNLTIETMKFTVAMLQIAAFGDDQGRNLAKGLQYCRDSKSLGADLAVFPELWNTGMAG